MAAVDIKLSVGESRETTALRMTGHHWTASTRETTALRMTGHHWTASTRETTALRMTGHHWTASTTPVEAMLAEVNLPSMKAWAIHLSTIAMEKSLRSTQTHQRPSGYGNAPKSQADVEKQVMSFKNSSVMLSPLRQHLLCSHARTPTLTPLS